MDLSGIEFWAGFGIAFLDALIVIVLIPKILSERRESSATLAWVFFILLVPILGLLAFWAFGTTRLRLRRRRRRKVEAYTSQALQALHADRDAPPEPEAPFPGREDTLRLVRRLGRSLPVGGNEVTLYRHGPSMFLALEKAVDAATHHVHFEYYIWSPDEIGTRIRDALIRAAHRGVRVRVLVDDVGASETRAGFFYPLLEAGGEVHRFLPVYLFDRRMSLNNRNHRKITVVDGVTAFTGGVNIADEYAGIDETWRDAMIRVRGPAAAQFQEVFCEDWYHASQQDVIDPTCFPHAEHQGDAWVQVLASGPDDRRWHNIHMLLVAMIHDARERVWIETPYFVPDLPMEQALQTAALRGVDVRVLLPARPDIKLMRYAARAHFEDLLKAGVKIFELDESATLHAKTVLVDRCFATVGSTNMDQRSFRLNFEANAVVFGDVLNAPLERSFTALEADATRVTWRTFQRRPRPGRILEGLGRILGPLL